MFWGQFMELWGGSALRLRSPHCSQVFVEVSRRSGGAIGWLDKITSESAPTDKHFHQTPRAPEALEPFPGALTAVPCSRLLTFFRGIQPNTHAEAFFISCCFFLPFLPQRVSSNPPRVCQTLRPPFLHSFRL